MLYVEGDAPYYQFNIFQNFAQDVEHAMSCKHGGVSEGPYESLNLNLLKGDDVQNMQKNYEIFCNRVGVPLENLVLAYQEHSDQVLRINESIFERKQESDYGFKGAFKGVDGFMTNLRKIPLMVRFADCQGALFFDPMKKVIAAVHSGWRGNSNNILGKTICKMCEDFECNPKDILVGISASLGPCCAEFSDPYTELPESMHKYVENGHVDLWKCSFDQLIAEGVDPLNIEIARRCTVCENNEFFSYRAGKKITGHMGGVIMLR